jgi:MscS family membrane protein
VEKIMTLESSFYGNTILEWLIALGIIAGAFVVGKGLYLLLGGAVRKLTEKTKTRLDDILIDMLEEPLVFAVIVIGIWVGTHTLNLSEGMALWLGRVFYVLVIINIAWLVSRTFDALVEEYIVPLVDATEGDFDDQLLPIARRAVKMVIWVLAIVVALNNAGYDIGALLAGLGIGGLAFALAAQDMVSNLFGGFTIFTDRPFTVHDRIKVGGLDGSVQEIGVRSTRIKTLEGRTVTVPNSKIAHDAVENVTSEPARKVVLNLGLTYDMNADQVQKAMDVLVEIAAANQSVQEEPTVGFNAFGDFALGILFIYWVIKGEDILGTQTAVNLEILRRFSEAGLDMAFPTQTVYTIPQSAA